MNSLTSFSNVDRPLSAYSALSSLVAANWREIWQRVIFLLLLRDQATTRHVCLGKWFGRCFGGGGGTLCDMGPMAIGVTMHRFSLVRQKPVYIMLRQRGGTSKATDV